MRLDKPIGIYLLLWPTYWGLWFASSGQPSLKNLLIFTAGVFVMRAAGCVINDYADRDVDGDVTRTQHRPIPAGEIAPKHALTLFLVLLAIALMLVLQTNLLTIILAVIGVLLAAIYPFLKRLTHLPQLGLGIAWSWAVPMAFAAEQQTLPMGLWLISGAIVLWTIAFDTYYAMVDRQDDLNIGVKSTAILFGKYDLLIIAALQIVSLILLGLAGVYFNRGVIFALGLVIAAGYFIAQHLQARSREAEGCFNAFLNNHRVGMAIFIGLALDYNLQY
ncbi:MAG: 4-hydroxybenzoate octaprenyltransferase [Cellvibrionales bacterium UBA7375]|nr:MAG: 4-hydroxybenzoate octaprenyltransferase [Cellvibrionales bacterium UBA7375]